MPRDDPFRAAHLLGDAWEGYRWFESEEDRDRVFGEMTRLPPYYRDGDVPNQVVEKVEEG
jgi:hypothetical protein